MKKVLLFMLLFSGSFQTIAQLRYNFSVQNQTYVPLTGGISINGSTIWDDEVYQVPIGFNFKIHDSVISDFSLLFGTVMMTDTAESAIVSGFAMATTDLYDRGNAGGSSSVSPIRYQLTGTAPNRIFKAEVFNAGFYEEYSSYSTNLDSVSYQVWLYETSNIVELRYGPARISHATDYFFPTGQPTVGFVKNLDLTGGSITMYYYLKGNAAAPTIDSTNDLDVPISPGLSGWPSDGTVYRFSPLPTGVGEVARELNQVSLVNTLCRQTLILRYRGDEQLSYQILTVDGSGVSKNGRIGEGEQRIDLSGLAAGTYLIRVTGGGGIRSLRFVKL